MTAKVLFPFWAWNIVINSGTWPRKVQSFFFVGKLHIFPIFWWFFIFQSENAELLSTVIKKHQNWTQNKGKHVRFQFKSFSKGVVFKKKKSWNHIFCIVTIYFLILETSDLVLVNQSEASNISKSLLKRNTSPYYSVIFEYPNILFSKNIQRIYIYNVVRFDEIFH